MFGLFRRKVNTQDVKAFESAVNAINIYVALSVVIMAVCAL